jgi:hypothetical protein
VADDVQFPYDYDVVDIDALIIDHAYQRPLSPLVKTIEHEFDPALIGVLALSERADGKYAVIDGQTRLEAVRRKNLAYAKTGTDPMGRKHDQTYQPIRRLPSLVYYGLQRADEAYLFAKFQTERRRVTPYQRFHAELAAKDKDARAIDKAVAEVGLGLSEKGEQGKINAVTQLERLHAKDPALLREVLFVAAACWSDDPEGIRGEILGGLGQFIRTEKNLDLERLVDRLHGTQQLALRRRTAALREGRGGGYNTKHMAEVIAAEYRKTRRSG